LVCRKGLGAVVGPSKTKESLRSLSTEELVTLAQQDRLDALEELVNRHQRTVYVALYQLAPDRNDISDLTQDVLLRMCRSIKSLRNPKTFKFWLNRIITNLFYDELRKTPRRLNTISMDAPVFDDEQEGGSHDIPDFKDVPEKKLLNTELDKKIREAIAHLPEQFRTIIVLREIQGLSYEEIASLTHSNLGTVKSRLARARLKLQETLNPYLKGI
jgi:RNA polymerase sigma-70 factor (ECF subfamily)